MFKTTRPCGVPQFDEGLDASLAERTQNIFVKTYGCQMNVYDSVKMTELMRPHGYNETSQIEQADLIVLNTCHIREKAAEKVYSEIGRIRQVQAARAEATGRKPLLAIAGCVAQAEGELMVERAPDIDIVLGPLMYHRLPEIVAKRQRQRRAVVETEFPAESKFDHFPTDVATPTAISSFLSIQEGCDKFCSFCVVPYTRGAETSRSVAELINEAKRQVERGAVEITLLGQNVNAYHGEGLDGETADLADLLDALAAIDGLERLRYTTSHPRDMDARLIAQHRDNPKVMPYLHLPVQSGSDKVLQAMNRGYTAEHYLRIIDDLRYARPDIALSSDFIVGFPGETDADFQDTMRLVEAVGFSQCFSFKYSRRPGTPAAGMMKQVHEAVKAERLEALQTLLNQQAQRFNQQSVGTTQPVLVERFGRHAGQMVGRTPHFQSIHFAAAPATMGTIVEVAIEAVTANSLKGQLVAGESSQPADLEEVCA